MATMIDPALVCPKCGESIALTESLAAPLVAATRARYEQQLVTQAKVFADEKKTVSAQHEANERRAAELADAKKQRQEVAQAVEDQVAAKLVAERKTIAEQESLRARRQLEEELQAERDAATQQKERIVLLTRKLTLAQEAEAGLRRCNSPSKTRSGSSRSNSRKVSPPVSPKLARRLWPKRKPVSISRCRTATTRSRSSAIRSPASRGRRNKALNRRRASRWRLFSNIDSAPSSPST